MKLYYEEESNINFEQEINESGNSTGVYKIKGIFSTIGEKNKNGRVYPFSIWDREVNAYQSVIAGGASGTLMELNHPPRANVEMMEAVAKINKLYVSDDKKYVMGEAILLDNPKANQLKTLIDAGIKMSVSSRGVGKVSATGIVENFKLVTYDIIPDQGQSDYNAQMMGIVEGVLTEREFEVLESGCIGECELPSVNESEDFKHVSTLKEILEKHNATILCDLSKEEKEVVLEEFLSSFEPKEITEVKETKEVTAEPVEEDYKDVFEGIEVGDYKGKLLALIEHTKKYEDYARKEYETLQESIIKKEDEELKLKEKAEAWFKEFKKSK